MLDRKQFIKRCNHLRNHIHQTSNYTPVSHQCQKGTWYGKLSEMCTIFFYFTTIYSVHISMYALKQISKAWVTSYTIEKEMFSGTIVLWAGRVQCDTWGVFSIVRGLGDWPLHYFNATYIFVNLLKQICNKLSWKLCLNIHIGSSRI